MNYFTLLQKQAAIQPQKVLLQLNRRAYTYAEIAADASALAAQIPCRGAIVLIDSPRPIFQLVAFFALQAAGNIAIISHHDLPRPALRQIMKQNGALHLLADRADACDASRAALTGAFLFTLPGEAQKPPAAPLCMGALSSGSSGVPKLLLRTYESWAGFFPTQNDIFHLRADSRLFMHGGLGFTGNLNALLAALSAGASVLLAEAFRCKTWLQRIEAEQATAIYLVPAKLQALQHFLHAPLLSVKTLFTGSQQLSAATIDALNTYLPSAAIFLYYGASELNYITYITDADLRKYPLSVGKPFPGVEISIQNETIYVKTSYRVYGAPNPCTVEDAGYFNADEHLIFLGRKQNIINKGGFKISCVKIEQALLAIPGVYQAAVLPCDDAIRGCEPAAFLVANASADSRTIRAAVKETLQPVEIPKKIHFLPRLPLNSRGKIDVNQLKKYLEKH